MSKIISKSILTGDKQIFIEGKSIYVVDETKLSLDEAELVKFKRSLSKDGQMALSCLNTAKKAYNKNFDRMKTGLYSAFLQGPFLSNLVEQTENCNFSEAFTIYRLNTPPKQVFRQNSAVKSTHLAITMQTNGPQMTFVSPKTGFIDALNAAEIDLHTGEVEIAVVTGSFSIEEAQTLRFYQQYTSEHVQESAICLILEKSDTLVQYEIENASDYSLGICSPYLLNNFKTIKY